MRLPRYLPIVFLVAIALIWGYSWVPGKLGVADSSAFAFAAMRTFPAGLLLLALLRLLGRPLRPKAVGLTAAAEQAPRERSRAGYARRSRSGRPFLVATAP